MHQKKIPKQNSALNENFIWVQLKGKELEEHRKSLEENKT